MITSTQQVAFVTGGAGFLGRRLVNELLKSNLKVRCLVRRSTDLTELLAELSEDQQRGLTFVYGDVSDRRLLDEELPGVDIVYHLAAAMTGSASTMFLNTVVPTRTLLEAAALANVGRFVLISSLGIYGTNDLKSGATLNEETPVDPHAELRDPYTLSKVRQEEVAWKAHHELDLPLVVVRPGVIYGPGRSLLTSRVGLALGPLFLRMGGRRKLPYVHVESCARAIASAGTTPDVEGEVFNVIDDDLPTARQVLKIVNQHGRKVRSVCLPGLAIQPLSAIYEYYSNWTEGQLPSVITRYKSKAIWSNVRYNNQKAKSKLGWQPTSSTKESLIAAASQPSRQSTEAH